MKRGRGSGFVVSTAMEEGEGLLVVRSTTAAPVESRLSRGVAGWGDGDSVSVLELSETGESTPEPAPKPAAKVEAPRPGLLEAVLRPRASVLAAVAANAPAPLRALANPDLGEPGAPTSTGTHGVRFWLNMRPSSQELVLAIT